MLIEQSDGYIMELSGKRNLKRTRSQFINDLKVYQEKGKGKREGEREREGRGRRRGREGRGKGRGGRERERRSYKEIRRYPQNVNNHYEPPETENIEVV